jgi:hypothetical protein
VTLEAPEKLLPLFAAPTFTASPLALKLDVPALPNTLTLPNPASDTPIGTPRFMKVPLPDRLPPMIAGPSTSWPVEKLPRVKALTPVISSLVGGTACAAGPDRTIPHATKAPRVNRMFRNPSAAMVQAASKISRLCPSVIHRTAAKPCDFL